MREKRRSDFGRHATLSHSRNQGEIWQFETHTRDWVSYPGVLCEA
jgi:hypothetical protein